MITKEKAREVAARIWCDPEYSHVEMNPDLAMEIAELLYKDAMRQNTHKAMGFMQAKGKSSEPS